MTDLKLKISKWGDVRWIGFDADSYAIVCEGTTSRTLVDSRDVAFVRRCATGGWDVVVYGEVAENARLKVDAQMIALEYIR